MDYKVYIQEKSDFSGQILKVEDEETGMAESCPFDTSLPDYEVRMEKAILNMVFKLRLVRGDLFNANKKIIVKA